MLPDQWRHGEVHSPARSLPVAPGQGRHLILSSVSWSQGQRENINDGPVPGWVWLNLSCGAQLFCVSARLSSFLQLPRGLGAGSCLAPVGTRGLTGVSEGTALRPWDPFSAAHPAAHGSGTTAEALEEAVRLHPCLSQGGRLVSHTEGWAVLCAGFLENGVNFTRACPSQEYVNLASQIMSPSSVPNMKGICPFSS